MLNALRKLTDVQLKNATLDLAIYERKITAKVVTHIAEVDRRKLYLKWGFSSLFDYLVNELKYSESAAFRRIQAARALNKTPEIKLALETGEIKLSQVASAQTAIRREEKSTGIAVSMSQRAELFAQLKNKTAVETEQILNGTFESAAQTALFADSCVEQHLGDGSVVLQLKLSKEQFAKLKRAKELYSHIDPNADWLKILDLMLGDVFKKRDPLVKKNEGGRKSRQHPKHSLKSTAATEVEKRKAIPATVRREIMQKSHGRCQYKSKAGRVCGSSYFPQIDHIRPVSEGGQNDLENLRILCGQHNRHVYKTGEKLRNWLE